MSNIVSYSKLNKKLNSKLNILKQPKIVNNMLLDADKFDNKFYIHGIYINNIIIAKSLLNKDVNIYGTDAKNIYFENCENLGDITIPFGIKGNLYISFKENNKIKKINILNKKNISIDLEDNVENINIRKDEEIKIIVQYKNKRIIYVVDRNNIYEIKDQYKLTDKDLCDDSLNLCNLCEYNSFDFEYMTINTLIINKHYLENIKKIVNFNKSALRFRPYHSVIKFEKLRIIDDNEMLLKPIDITFDNGSYMKTTFCDADYKYIKIEEKDNCVLIFLDKNNNIKILEENEMKKQAGVEKVYFDFHGGLFENYSNLVVVKYKDYYKIIDFEKEYIVNSLFFELISKITNKYNASPALIEALENYDLIRMFDNCDISKNRFLEMYEDYTFYKNYLVKLKELGFTNASIKYLLDKKIESIIFPNEDNLKEISETEVKCFNEIGEDYVKKKRLEYE